jgi:WD40 repeat protein
MNIDNPYVGPRAFTEREANRFFGRQREARDLLARVVSERLLLFYAQSGAGKSSLLHTRLIPGLRDHEGFQVLPVGRVSGALPAGAETVDNIYLFNLLASLEQSGGASAALAERLAHVTLPDFLARLAGERTTDADGNSARRWIFRPDAPAAPPLPAGSGPRFALIIDQFEEIISTHPERWAERADFFRQLDAALRTDPNLWIVLTLREDYVASLDPYAALVTNKLQARYRMERMDVAAALEAVRRPAALGGRPFAPGVAETLVDDLRQIRLTGQAGAVPGQYVEPVQLQVVCYQLWERLHEARNQVSDRNQVSQEDLAAAGDVDRALEEFYAATLAAVTADPAVVAAGVSERSLRTWFDKELITPSGIRSIVLRNEGSGRTGSLPNAAVDALSQRFLLRTELRGGGAWVELVHDRFVEPIRASNEAWFAEHLSTLQRAAALWQDSGRASGLLLADAALDDAVVWASTHALLPYEQEFLDASLQLRAAAERERKLRKRISILAIAASIGLIVAIMALIFAGIRTKEVEDAKQDAEFQTRRVKASELAAEAQIEMAKAIPDPVLSLLLAKEAISATLTVDHYVHEKAGKALLEAIEAAPPWVMNLPFPSPGESVHSAVFSPDVTRILTAGCDEYDEEVNCLRGSARVWARDGVRLLFTLDGHGCGAEWHSCEVLSAGYSRDGSHIVTVGADGQAIVWDVDNGKEVRRFGEESAWIVSAGLSADGAQIVTNGCALTGSDCDAAIDVRAILTGQILYSLHPEYHARSVSFSPDDAQILTVNWDGTAQVWDVASRRAVLTLGSEDQPIYAAAFSPNGDRVVTVGCDERAESLNCRSGVARIWQATDGTLLTTLPGHRTDILTASFSPDGSRVLTASWDGTARVWDATTGDMLLMLNDPGNGMMSSAAFSPDSAQIVTAAGHGPAKIWDANRQQVPAVVQAHDLPISSIEFSADGVGILTASWDGISKLRDVHTSNLVREFAGHQGSINSARFSPNNDRIVTASMDGTAILWDAVSGQHLHEIQHGCSEDGSYGSCGVESTSFSPDGSYVVTTGYDGFARVWDAATGAPVRSFGPHADLVTSASFSRDGKQMVTADRQENVTIWDAVTGEEIRSFKGGWRAAYNPAGDRVATGGITGTLTTWNATTGDRIWSVDAHDDLIVSVEYSPAGDMIVTASRDGSAKLWDVATRRLLFTYTGHGCATTQGCDVSAATFSPDGQYVATGGYDGTVRIWPATVDALLELADSLIAREPPLLTPEERQRYGLE